MLNKIKFLLLALLFVTAQAAQAQGTWYAVNDSRTAFTQAQIFSTGTYTMPNDALGTIISSFSGGHTYYDGKIRAAVLGESLDFRIKINAKSTIPDSKISFSIDIGNGIPIEILNRELSSPSHNYWKTITSSTSLYALNTFMLNGGEIKLKVEGEVEIFGVEYLITSTGSNMSTVSDSAHVEIKRHFSGRWHAFFDAWYGAHPNFGYNYHLYNFEHSAAVVPLDVKRTLTGFSNSEAVNVKRLSGWYRSNSAVGTIEVQLIAQKKTDNSNAIVNRLIGAPVPIVLTNTRNHFLDIDYSSVSSNIQPDEIVSILVRKSVGTNSFLYLNDMALVFETVAKYP